MGKPVELSQELRNSILWLERQPGVTSVVKGRVNGGRHGQAPGSTKVMSTDQKTVHLKTYDKKYSIDLFVYASRSTNRDKWVADIVGGTFASQTPKLVRPDKTVTDAAKRPQPNTQHGVEVDRPVGAIVQNDAGQLYDVTPEMAAKWLEHNTRNRALREQVVRRYAADMKAGRWMVTGDAIAFDKNGTIANGQHRLWAVFESGVTVRMLVVFGLDPEVVNVLDDHLKRSLGDVAKIRRPGAAISTAHCAIAKMLLTTTIMNTAVERRVALDRVTRQDELDSMDRHWDAIDFAVRDCFRSRKLRSITVAPIHTTCARAYYTQDRERIREFAQALVTGVMKSEADKPAVLLRNMLVRMATNSVKAESSVIYRKAERALQAFIERETLATLYEASGELFPLPEEQTGRRRK